MITASTNSITEEVEKFQFLAKLCFKLDSSLVQASFKLSSSLARACIKLSSILAKPKMAFQQPVHTVTHKKFKYCNFGLNSALSLIQAWFKPCSSLVQAWLELVSSLVQAWLNLKCPLNSQYKQ